VENWSRARDVNDRDETEMRRDVDTSRDRDVETDTKTLPQGHLTQAAVSVYCRHPVTPAATQWYSLLLRAAYGAVAHALLCRPIVNRDDSAVFPFSLMTLTFDPQIRIREKFLYNAPNCQVSSSYV